jgi:hypothetical protein
MFSWFNKNKSEKADVELLRVIDPSGILISKKGAVGNVHEDFTCPVSAAELSSLLIQLEDEGFAITENEKTLISWGSAYQLLKNPHYSESMEAFKLPPIREYLPALRSFNSLIDSNFSIAISDWHDSSGRPLSIGEGVGPVRKARGELALLSEAVWRVTTLVSAFQARSENDRNDLYHRRAWGSVRQLAISAGARLDGFLFKNVVLTPEKLEIGLRKSEVPGERIVEVAPSFEGAPEDWLEVFDSRREVPDRYDIPTQDGIVQILITPEVKSVLQEIKRMPGRRVAGSRAEAFLLNPFAALGEAATSVIDEQQFEEARADANLTFDRFVANIERDPLGYPDRVGLLIESSRGGRLTESSVHWFNSDSDLAAFIYEVSSALSGELQLCAWDGYDFELLGDTPSQIKELADAYQERKSPKILVRYANVFDISKYASRVEAFGLEKPYYSPYIAKKKDEESWFPENIIPMISWTPDGEDEPIAVPITEQAKEQLKAKVAQAEATGKDNLILPGFEKPIPLKEAKAILDTFDEVFSDAAAGTFDPEMPKRDSAKKNKSQLVVKANIQSIDYEEARRDILRALPARPSIPGGLLAHVQLKEHQEQGIAWLQHLYLNAPKHCRGAVLADDMGLGKTLQLLTLIAWAVEMNSDIQPALIVAPVSLLENWKEEAGRFFKQESLPMLTAYGEGLRDLRVPRSSIDAQLMAEGLVKFLKPNWRGNAKVVLTTYETLRDLEFSFAAEQWSIMVCDEAQKIKNPNAMVTRAAKKQNVEFKIACTGTPVENTLADIWCLFDFIQPGLLGALNDFGRRYRRPIEAETEEEKSRVDELRGKIAPQILRRMKQDVARDLPQKSDVECRIQLSAKQRSLYAQAVELFKKRNDPGFLSPFKNHLGLLHYLRLICTDPRKIGQSTFKAEELKAYKEQAPKLSWLLQQLSAIRLKQEKAIIFCEFREIQRMLRHYISEVFEFDPDIINGDTSASSSHTASRQKRIKAFQSAPGFGVIILSPVAVGFGVNIQAANHVIHYTRTWNPAKEDQATDRSYRIGQERDVFVYCPVVYAEDFTTFDVKLDQLLKAKRKLAGDMLNGTGDIQPGEFDLVEVIPGASTDLDFGKPLTLDDALNMSWDYLEALTAALMKKKGYKIVYRTPKTDDGVDVVAYTGKLGELIQCKCSNNEAASLSWDAVKDVVTGEASYKAKHPGVTFKKTCLTNQAFNGTAAKHAALNEVSLINQHELGQMLKDYPVSMLNVEHFLYQEWAQPAAA